MSSEELKSYANDLGIAEELIKVQDAQQPDLVTITIAKPDGRSLKRVIPREAWADQAYRASLISNMGTMLA